MNETKTERLHLCVTYLPTGATWESVSFHADKREELHALIDTVDGRMHFSTTTGNRVYLPAEVLKQCSIELRSVWS